MHFIPGNIYHVYNRGNNKQKIFFSERNYQFFRQKISHQISPVCEILAWCLMPNHFHLMIYATDRSCVDRASFGGKPMQELPYHIGILLSSYSQAINKQNNTPGSLFQQKTKAKCINDPTRKISGELNGDYLAICMHYIHQNPWKAKLVERMEDWKYSSFGYYIGKECSLKTNKPLLLSLVDYDESNFYKDSYALIDAGELEGIW
jgi:putative transposase